MKYEQKFSERVIPKQIHRFPIQVFIEDVPRTPVSWKTDTEKRVRFPRSNPFYFQLAAAADGLTFHDAIFTQLFIASPSLS